MTITWLYFAPALALLLFPQDRLIPARARLRTLEELKDRTRDRGFWLWVHPFAAVRAGLGAWLLVLALSADPEAPLWTGKTVLASGIVIGVLAIAVLVQCFTRRDIDYALAPVFYLGGMMLALLPWQVSLCALILAAASTLAFRNWMTFFLVAAPVIGGAGVLWDAPKLLVAAAGGLIFLPALFAFGSGRILTVPSRQ